MSCNGYYAAPAVNNGQFDLQISINSSPRRPATVCFCPTQCIFYITVDSLRSLFGVHTRLDVVILLNELRSTSHI